MRLAILCCYQVSACLNYMSGATHHDPGVHHRGVGGCGPSFRVLLSWLRLKSDPLPFVTMRLCGYMDCLYRCNRLTSFD